MEIIKLDLNHKMNIDKPIIVGLGQFDGLHRGHLKLIDEVITLGRKKNYSTGIVTFDPHPDYVLGKRHNDGYITPLPEKIKLLEKLNLDYLFILNFTQQLSRLSPDQFYEKFLLPFKAIVIGSDYRYGYQGKGNSETLKQTGKEVIVVPLLEYENEKIGSNKIRQLLLEGRVDKIYELLDRYYHIVGTVSKGSQVGRTLGFKTANIELKEEYQLLKKGVYAVIVKVRGREYLGVCNIGNNPSVNFTERMRLEVHIFDFNQNIYGEKIEINFLERIRDELKFSDINNLINQIHRDIEYVKGRYQK